MIIGTTLAQAQERMSLEKFLKLVQEKNLDLKVDAAKSDAASARAIGVNIPPPVVSFNHMKMDMGDSANGFEVSQAIPFPTKLSSNSSARKYEAKAQQEIRLSQEKEILAQGKLFYFSLWENQEKISLMEEKKKILEDHIMLSRSSARSDSFAAIHVLKAESDLDLLDNEIELANQLVREAQLKVASFLNEDPVHFQIIAEEPTLSPIPQITSAEDSHQVQALNFNLESFKAKEFEAKSSWLPDINLSYKEMGATTAIPRYNEIMVGVTLPFIFFWEPYAASKSASAERMQAQVELEKQKRNIDVERVTLLSKVESLKKQILILKKKAIPRVEKRMKLVHNLAPRDMETLQDHRETMEALPELKMKALEFRHEYEQAISTLEKYVSEKGLSHE